MRDLQSGDLKIEYIPGTPPGPIQLVWRGKSNDRAPGKFLEPYFFDALDAATSTSGGIEMHFEEIEHFNSSTITAVIRMIEEARRRGVKLSLTYSQTRKWQRISFEPLRVFSADGFVELKAV
jgi:hypothetical protein